jgi:hypothetical protein
MASAVALRKESAIENDSRLPTRDEVLARYHQLREIGKQHHHDVMSLISGDAMLGQARRLGLAQGKTLILDDMDEMTYVYDLSIHTAPPGRTRAIDRYARSARLAAGSDEALVLDAMRAARFSLLVVERRHEAVGLIASDVIRRTQVWLVDIGLESSLPDGAVIATRIYAPDRFAMTAGVNVPFDADILMELHSTMPRHLAKVDMAKLIDDRRFAEFIYRVALAGGVMDRVSYQEPAGLAD